MMTVAAVRKIPAGYKVKANVEVLEHFAVEQDDKPEAEADVLRKEQLLAELIERGRKPHKKLEEILKELGWDGVTSYEPELVEWGCVGDEEW